MKLPVNFEQFSKEPNKAIVYLLLCVIGILYIRSEYQSRTATNRCEERLNKCEASLETMSKMLKTQDSLCSALITEIKIYKALGKI